jgi:hypothetical protein
MVRSLITATLMALSCALPTAALAAPLPPSLGGLLETANDLYIRAATIVGRTPHSGAEASTLASPSAAGGRFYALERGFQDRVSALPPTGELESTRAQATVRLGQFDNFVHTAVVDALASCDASQARVNLRVARELLQELRRIASGRGHADWNPPSLEAAMNATSEGHCS